MVDPKIQPKIQGSFIMDKSATSLPQNGHIEPENPHLSHGSATRQILAALVAQLGTVNTGMAFGFSAIAISQLRDVNSTMPIDDTQESWIGKFLLSRIYSRRCLHERVLSRITALFI